MSPRPRNRGNNRSRKSSQNKRRQQNRGPKPARSDGAGFWGDPSKLPSGQPEVRITEDPPAVVRSLGPPPLAGHETIAEHYFAAVYDRAVGLAGALAAAGDLIKPEELPEERGD
jgi:hypothetical protein